MTEDEDKTKNEEKADASNDQDSKTNAEAAEMDTTQASKDMTKVNFFGLTFFILLNLFKPNQLRNVELFLQIQVFSFDKDRII